MRVRAVSARKVAATAAADIATITASVAIAPVATPVTVAAVALTTAASACGAARWQARGQLGRRGEAARVQAARAARECVLRAGARVAAPAPVA